MISSEKEKELSDRLGALRGYLWHRRKKNRNHQSRGENTGTKFLGWCTASWEADAWNKKLKKMGGSFWKHLSKKRGSCSFVGIPKSRWNHCRWGRGSLQPNPDSTRGDRISEHVI